MVFGMRERGERGGGGGELLNKHANLLMACLEVTFMNSLKMQIFWNST